MPQQVWMWPDRNAYGGLLASCDLRRPGIRRGRGPRRMRKKPACVRAGTWRLPRIHPQMRMPLAARDGRCWWTGPAVHSSPRAGLRLAIARARRGGPAQHSTAPATHTGNPASTGPRGVG